MADGIYARFVSARAAVKNPQLDSINPHFKNRYASLAETLGEVHAACVPHGISYVQALRRDGSDYYIESYVIDGEGGRIDLSQFPVSHVPNPQNFGSEMTYKKRQQAQADWGIVGDEDDDGEAAANACNPKQTQKPAPKQPGRFAHIYELKAEALELGISEEGIKAHINASFERPMKDFNAADVKALESYLEGIINDRKMLLQARAPEMVA